MRDGSIGPRLRHCPNKAAGGPVSGLSGRALQRPDHRGGTGCVPPCAPHPSGSKGSLFLDGPASTAWAPLVPPSQPQRSHVQTSHDSIAGLVASWDKPRMSPPAERAPSPHGCPGDSPGGADSLSGSKKNARLPLEQTLPAAGGSGRPHSMRPCELLSGLQPHLLLRPQSCK